MPGRYSGPLGKAFSGDRDVAMSLQGRARILVQQVWDAINGKPLDGKGSLHRADHLPDGTVIHAYVNTMGVWPIVRTWIESPIYSVSQNEEKTYTYTLVSGMFDGKNFSWETDEYLRRVQFLQRQDNGTWVRGPWENSPSDKRPLSLVPSILETQYGCGAADNYAVVTSAYSGQFSGEMRKVVQLLLGMAVNDGMQTVTKPVLYSPCFALCHGIFVTSTGARWVIECASSGITAWPLPIVDGARPSTEDGIDLPYFPLPVDALPDAADRVVLLDASGVSSFYSKQMMYALSGWAFNRNGHKAVNIVWDTPEDEYRVTHLCHLSIVEENGAPAFASLTIESGKYLFGYYDSLTMLKTPRYTGAMGASVFNWPLSQNWVVGSAAPPRVESAPVHAYYAGSELITIYHGQYWARYPYQLGIFTSSKLDIPINPGFINQKAAPFTSMVIPFKEREGVFLYQGYAVVDDEYGGDVLYFYRGKDRTTLFERNVSGDDINSVILSPFVFIVENSANGQWMDATLDAFTGAGAVSISTEGGSWASNYKTIGGAGTLYKLTETTASRGWFGAPFPDLL